MGYKYPHALLLAWEQQHCAMQRIKSSSWTKKFLFRLAWVCSNKINHGIQLASQLVGVIHVMIALIFIFFKGVESIIDS